MDVTEVKHAIAALKMARENVMIHHREWFNIIEEICYMAGVVPRLCSHQRNRSNVPAENACDYYRRVTSIPLLDHLVSEFESCFNSHNQATLQGLYLVPSVLVSKCLEENAPKVQQLAEMYISDLPYISSLQSELQSWYLKWKQ